MRNDTHKETMRNWAKRRAKENRRFLERVKLVKGCKDCGYRAHHAGLEFDHVKPRLYGCVSTLVWDSRSRLKEEMRQTEVVCAVCHNIRTHNRRNN